MIDRCQDERFRHARAPVLPDEQRMNQHLLMVSFAIGRTAVQPLSEQLEIRLVGAAFQHGMTELLESWAVVIHAIRPLPTSDCTQTASILRSR